MSFTNYIKTLFQTHHIGFGYVLQYESPYNFIYVSEILKDSPTSESAMKVGDIVVSINNTIFSSEASFVDFMRDYCANIDVSTATIITLQKAHQQEMVHTIILFATKLKSNHSLLCKLHNMREHIRQSLGVMVQLEGIGYNRRTKKIEVWHNPNRPTNRDIEEILE